MSLTKRMAEWVAANDGRLREFDHVLFRESRDDREKPSAHLSLLHGEWFGEAIVWDSGEVETSYGTRSEPHDQHHEVDDPAELDDILRNLLLRVR
jgi:hypothetical protein